MMALSLIAPILIAPSLAFAACSVKANSSSDQVLGGIGEGSQGNGTCDDSGVGNTISEIVSILSYVAGAIAVIMIMVAGVKYTTSGGDSNKVTNAKSTLIYALIGVAIAALAQVLVHYVLSTSNSLGS
jgi:hypothetical protein